METVRTQTWQAQGWGKWLPGSDLLGGTNFRESTPLPRLFVLFGTYYGSFAVYRNGLSRPENPLMEMAM
jgi:hypothetical protein